MTLPSASSPNERPLEDRGEGDAVAAAFAPPAGAVSLAELIADSGPLPADAALECVQRIAERLTNAGRPSCAALAPGDVFVDDDGGVWLRDSVETGRVDAERDGQPLTGMNRIGKLLAFVATGDGAHLTDGAKVDPATLPPPLSSVAYRLFSRNGACYRTYADLAHDIAQLRVVGSDAVDSDASEKVACDVDGRNVSEISPAVGVGRERLQEVETPAEANVASNDGEPAEGSSRFAVAVIVVFLLGAAIAFVLWQLL